jgi:hypothetical protein
MILLREFLDFRFGCGIDSQSLNVLDQFLNRSLSMPFDDQHTRVGGRKEKNERQSGATQQFEKSVAIKGTQLGGFHFEP